MKPSPLGSAHHPSGSFLGLIGLLTGAIFMADVFLPLGIAGGVPYILVILLSLRHRDPHLPLWTAVGCSMLTIVGFFFAPPGGELGKVLVNRALVLFAIWTTALMGRFSLQQTGPLQPPGTTIQDFLETIPSACFTFDRQGTILSWNPAAETTYGYSKEKAVGASSFDLLATPETKKDTKNVIAAIFQGKVSKSNRHDWDKNGGGDWGAGNLFPVFDIQGHVSYGVHVHRDVPTQKTSALQTENALLEAILNSPTDAIYAKDCQGRHLLVNQAAADVIGKSPEAIIGLDDTQLFGPEIAKVLHQYDEIVLAQNRSLNFEETISNHDSPRVFSSTKSPLIGPAGEVIGLVGISREITDLKQVQKDLLLANLVFMASMDHISILGRDYRYRRVNPSYERVHKKSSQDLVGMSVSDLLGEEAFTQTVKPMLDRCFQGEEVHYESWFTFPGTNHRYMSVSYLPLVIHDQTVQEIVVLSRDWTERKNVEDALHASERQSRTVLDAMINFVGIGTVDGIVQDCNQVALDMAGLHREDVIGKPFVDTYWLNFSSAVQEQVGHIFQRVARGETVREDIQARMRDNQIITVDACYTPVRDANGNVVQIVHSAIDVTAQREAENRLRQSEDQFRDLYESAPLAYFSASCDGHITRVNARASELLGYPPQELVGRQAVTLYAPTEHGQEKAARLQKMLQEGTSIHGEELEMMRKDGRHIWVSLTVRPIYDEGGDVIEQHGIVKDITQRKKVENELRASEYRYRSLIDTAGSVIVGLTPEGRIIEWNHEAERVFGKSREEILDKNYLELFIQERDQAPIMADIRKVLAEEPTRGFENPVISRDGELRHISWNVDRLLDENQQPYGVIAIGRDITEWKHAQAQLQKWATIFQHTQWGVAVGNAKNQTFEMVNEGYAHMHGYSVEELQGQPIAKIFAPAFRTQFPEIIRIIHEQGFHSFESLHIRKDGTTFPALVTVSAIKDHEGVVLYQVANVIDISNIKKAEQALHDSQQIYQDLVQTIEGIVWECEFPSYQITFVSQFAQSLLGYPLERWHADPQFFLSIIHPDDRQRVADYCYEASSRKENHTVEFRMYHANGNVRWVQDQVTVVVHNDRPVKLRGVILDITERKKAEFGFKNLVNTIDGIVWEFDLPSNRFTYVSQQAKRITGYPAEEWVKNPDFLRQLIHPDDVEDALNFCLTMSRQHRDHEMEYRVLRADGRVIWLRQIVTVIVEEQKPVTLRGIMVDITKGKETRAAFKNLVNTVDGIVWECEFPSYRFTYVSQQAERMLGYSPEEWISKPDFLYTKIHHDDRDEILEYCLQQTLKKQDHQTEFRMRQAEGQYLWLKNLVTVIIENDQPVQLRGIMIDITERKQMEQAIRQHNEELEGEVRRRTERIQELELRRMQVEKLAALAQIAAGVAHEINNPLASISQSLVLLKRAVPTEHPHFHYMARVEDCIDRIAKITQHLYQLYRPNNPTPMRVELHTSLQNAVEIMHTRASKDGVNLTLVSDPTPLFATVSKGELTQVVCNLIQNAIQASPPKHTIEVSLVSGQETISIDIADQGAGISPDIAPRIFEPFFTTKQGRVEGGMGLGLSISQSLVKSMGGTLDFSTTIGQGSTFTITLPLAQDGGPHDTSGKHFTGR